MLSNDAFGRYSGLYDFAPVGYITIDFAGTIRDANLSAVNLLELNRGQVIRSNFSRFVAASGLEAWRKHLQITVPTLDKQVCELPLRTCSGESLWVRLESISVVRLKRWKQRLTRMAVRHGGPVTSLRSLIVMRIVLLEAWRST